MKKIVFLVAILSLFTSCNFENSHIPEVPGPISYLSPAVGQKSKYVLFIGKDYSQGDEYADYYYINDTLVTEITGKDEKGFRVREYVIFGEKSSDSDEVYIMDTVFTYYLKPEGDSLFVHNGNSYLMSHLFFYKDKFRLALTKINTNKITIKGWKTELNFSENIKEGFAENFTILGKKYTFANVIINNRAMAHDGPGYTIIYEPNDGTIRFYTVNPWTDEGIGWDRL